MNLDRKRSGLRIAGIAIAGLVASQAQASNPTIVAVSPNSVGNEGGSVTVMGTDFATDAVVKIGGYACADVKIASATKLTCTAPRNIARKADVILANADGGTVTLPAGLAYSGTPTLALLQIRVFQRFAVNAQGVTVVYKCSACHGGAKPDGDLDIKMYDQLVKHVVPGDAKASKLYTDVRDYKMPIKEKQPELKDEEKQAVSDWIADGAKNN